MEFRNLHGMEMLIPFHTRNLSKENKAEDLRHLIFLKGKRDGTIKSRVCVDGISQRKKYAKEETAPTNISTKSVIITCIVDAEENQEVEITDFSGALHNTDMVLERKIAKLLV